MRSSSSSWPWQSTSFCPGASSVGQHYTLPQTAGFAIVFLLLLAGLPLMHPRLRRNTISATFPILIGGICLGVGVTYWVNLTQSQDRLQDPLPHPYRHCPRALTAGPDFGLFGFLIGAAALAVLGYYLLLAAARAPVQELARQQAPVETGQAVGSGPAAVSTTEPAPVETAKESSPEAENNVQRDTKSAKESTPQIALPGSDAWTRTLEPPTFVRPKVGAIRRTTPVDLAGEQHLLGEREPPLRGKSRNCQRGD